MTLLRQAATLVVLGLTLVGAQIQVQAQTQLNDSGGPLSPEQAAYDVTFYELDLRVDVKQRSIEGSLLVRAKVLEELSVLLLDLDHRLSVRAVKEPRELEACAFVQRDGRIWISLEEPRQAGQTIELLVEYGGQPRVAPRPPWDGGFTWAETADGSPWIATSNQGSGGDLWWPCKDHPSDEPDSMRIKVRVPEPLVCASNGRLESLEEHEDGTRTYDWFVSTPISNYTVALNIAPYKTIERDYESTSGDRIPVTYWVLPENHAKGLELMDQIVEHLRFMEENFGPYPFRADKYGVVETPHLGMEHQTIIAYGNQYKDNEWGFDWLHHHELAHEWWANLVTAPDWNDFWIHEGIATYAQNMYVEELHGERAYRESMAQIRRRILNRRPVAPRESRTAGQMYFLNLGTESARRQSDSDIYFKGAWVLHSLRFLIGDEAFSKSLRRMAYPDPALEKVKDGSQCRFGTTDDLMAVAEAQSGMKLDWFFEVYLRQARLPRLVGKRQGESLNLSWDVPGNLPFPMPVEVAVDGEKRRVDVPAAGTRVDVGSSKDVKVDPDEWVLKRWTL